MKSIKEKINESNAENVMELDITSMGKKYNRVFAILPEHYQYSTTGQYKVYIVGANKQEDLLKLPVVADKQMLPYFWNLEPDEFQAIEDVSGGGDWNVYRVNIE